MNSNPIQAQAILQTALVDTSSGVIIRQWYGFFAQLQALISSNYQPVFDVTQYGSTGNGSTADDIGINGAIRAAVDQGGGTIYFPPVSVFYNITSPLAINTNIQGYNGQPITFLGSGAASMIKRGANMPTGQGMFDLAGAQNVTFANLNIDGNVTESVGVTYGQIAGFGYDPLNSLFTTNTSIWLHDGCENINFCEITISHTGGYSILCEVNAVDINDVYFYRVNLLNCRPFLFGNDPGDLNYGSWIGGILLHSLGTTSTATVNRARFLSCTARRCNGTFLWLGHVYGFNGPGFPGITCDDIYAEDCARDLIQLGVAHGARINGVYGHRIGYVTYDDTSPSQPKWLSGNWAVCLDYGVSFGVTTGNVSITSAIGGYCDLDGMCQCTLSNFTFRTPQPGEPDYVTDLIGTVPGFAETYGISQSIAGYGPWAEGSHKVSAGNITNMGLNALRMYSAHYSAYSDLRIFHGSTASGPPVVVENLGPANDQRSYGNTITNMHIEWSPVTPAPCIQETGGLSPFLLSDVNQYLMNQVISSTGATAVSIDPASGSIASITENIAFPAYSGTLKIVDGSIVGS